jgi:flagella basal body P-ring formation protein FlgA
MLVNRPFPVHVIDSGGIVASREAMLGKAARRVLPAGKPISINALADVTLVTKGVAARVRMEEHGLIISGFAMPLESGGVGAMIRLKNIDSNQIIVGTVQADGPVRVTIQ